MTPARTKILAIWLILMAFFVLQAQPTCVKSSGQTITFALEAGAQAAWNSTKVIYSNPSNSARSLSLMACKLTSGGMAFNLSGCSDGIGCIVTVYSVDGRKIAALSFGDGNSVVLHRVLANGVYVAFLENRGLRLKAIRFLGGR